MFGKKKEEEEDKEIAEILKQFHKDTDGNILQNAEKAHKRSALIGTGAVLVIVFFVQTVCRFWIYPSMITAQINDSLTAKREIVLAFQNSLTQADRIDSIKLHKFNPNTADSLELLDLGLKPRTIGSLIRYRNKYPIKSAEQFFGLYCMKDWDCEYLREYVDIPSEKKKGNIGSPRCTIKDNQPKATKGETSATILTEKIDINRADSAMFVNAFGITPQLAGRIIKFRTLLGGFYSAEQIQEVYGINHKTADAIIKSAVCSPSEVKKIKINRIEPQNLKHIYLRGEGDKKWKLTNAIQNKIKRGEYINNFAEIEAMEEYDEEANGKLRYYLDFD